MTMTGLWMVFGGALAWLVADWTIAANLYPPGFYSYLAVAFSLVIIAGLVLMAVGLAEWAVSVSCGALAVLYLGWGPLNLREVRGSHMKERS